MCGLQLYSARELPRARRGAWEPPSQSAQRASSRWVHATSRWHSSGTLLALSPMTGVWFIKALLERAVCMDSKGLTHWLASRAPDMSPGCRTSGGPTVLGPLANQTSQKLRVAQVSPLGAVRRGHLCHPPQSNVARSVVRILTSATAVLRLLSTARRLLFWIVKYLCIPPSGF